MNQREVKFVTKLGILQNFSSKFSVDYCSDGIRPLTWSQRESFFMGKSESGVKNVEKVE